ncbi:MAG: response regulator [Deltaproteobacteria bacterium]|nr:response regulator [Deltaproteobacteria bacterium]
MPHSRENSKPLPVAWVEKQDNCHNLESNCLSSLMDGNPISTFVINTDHHVVLWNHACEMLTGVPREKVLNNPVDSRIFYSGQYRPLLADLVLDMDESAIRRWYDKKNLTQSASIPDAYEASDELVIQGEKRNIYFVAAAIREPSGKIIGAIETIQDITDRSQLLSQLYQAQKMEALGALIAGVAHEINNPINLIMYNIPLLEKIWQDVLPVLNDQAVLFPQRKYGGLRTDFINNHLMQLISDMDMAAKRVATIVTGLKSFSRFSAQSEKIPLQINVAVENAIRLSQSTLRKLNVEIDLDLENDLPTISGNLQNIEQVILNLIINAAQAIEHDNGKIRISTRLQPQDGDIRISVSDNGKGVNPAIAGKLFDPFITDKQEKGGTGLGLSVSYNLIKSHDGTITFESRQGKGTTFHVLLPSALKRKPFRIMVVDDDATIREMLREILVQRRSYIVEEASNGIEACIRLGSSRPDLLVMDLFMPEMNGIEVCRVLKNDPVLSDMKIMMITGHEGHPLIGDISEFGFIDILYKPFNLEDFVTRVDNILLK